MTQAETRTHTLQTAISSKLDAACGKAMHLQLAGQTDLAGQLYGAILQAAPRHSMANYCMGMLHVHTKQPDGGLPYLITALEIEPQSPEYWLGLLEALTIAGRTDEARSTLALAREHGLAGEAVDDFARRLDEKTRPASPQPAVQSVPAAEGAPAGHPKRPAAKAARQPAAGRKRRRKEIDKQERELLSMVERGQIASALALARSLTERYPERGLGWKALGAFVSVDGGHEEAIAAMQTAVRLMPQDAEAYVNLGLTLAKVKRFEEAEFHLNKALQIKPGFAAAHYRLGLTYELQGRFAEAEASIRRGIALRTAHAECDDERAYSNLLFLISHSADMSPDELFAEHRRFGQYFEGRLRSIWPKHANDRNPDRRLKVGVVSGDLYQHAVASFLEPIVAQLKGIGDLALHAYYANSREDDFTRRLKKHFEGWNEVCFTPDLPLAAKIIEDEIDILIDLSGHTGQNRLPLFARKPAPIQISWMGYPGTTGLESMDYYFADPHFLTPGQFDRQFTEKLVYLPTAPFKPQDFAPPVGPLPALSAGCMTFGSFNRLGKINDATVRLWSALLREIQDARMFIAGLAVDVPHRLIEQFAACGVAAERLTFHGRCDMDKYLALHNQVDICLDTTPYNGGTTTIHALWMGVPTLNLAGPTPAARAGSAILGQMGLHDFIASTPAEFVEIGAGWSRNLARLSQLRATLRDRWRCSPGRQTEVIARAVDEALRHMWKRWCAGLPPESFMTTAAAAEAAGAQMRQSARPTAGASAA